MKKILVAGGCGFIGSHLCDRLIEDGHAVICLDNEVTGSWKNVEHLKSNKNFKILRHDVSKPLQLDEAVDEVYHLASPASPIDFDHLSVEIMRANALGTDHLLQFCAAKKARFLLASTSEVYGDPKVHPQVETYWGNVNPIGPRSPYDESKRYAEAFTTAFCRNNKVTYAIVRIFNTYGPRMARDDGRVVSNFITQALQHQPMTVFGNGEQTRCFCYVADQVDGLVRAMGAAKGMPINVGGTDEVKMLDFAKLVIELTGSRSQLVFKTLPQDDPRCRRPDTQRAAELLGWKPQVHLREGIKKSIEYFQRAI